MTTAGAVTNIGAPGVSYPRGLAFVGGTLYTGDRDSGILRSLDPANGSVLTTTAMVENGLVLVETTWSLATHPITGVLYLAYTAGGDRVLGTVGLATGVVTRIGAANLASTTASLAWL